MKILDELFQKVESSLFPENSEIMTNCNCKMQNTTEEIWPKLQIFIKICLKNLNVGEIVTVTVASHNTIAKIKSQIKVNFRIVVEIR